MVNVMNTTTTALTFGQQGTVVLSAKIQLKTPLIIISLRNKKLENFNVKSRLIGVGYNIKYFN